MRPFRSVLIMLVLCGGCAVFGRVFRIQKMAPGHINTVGLGWDFAYQTSMNVNGKQTDLHMYAVRPDMPVIDQLNAQFKEQGAEVSFQKTASGVKGQARFKDETTNFLVLSSRGLPNRMVFLFYPTVGKQTGTPALSVPDYPGAISGQTISNDKTGAVCRTIATEDDPARVQAFYASALIADGWSTVLPPSARSTRMAVYQKGKKVCLVQSAQRVDGVNRLTVLVNNGAF